jgi:hypothetical protein
MAPNLAFETHRSISNISFDFIRLNLKQRSGNRMETSEVGMKHKILAMGFAK